jgi:hypothetical protein
MKVNESGSTIYVVGSKVEFNKYNRETLSELENVKIVFLKNLKQLRGRTPRSAKRFIILSENDISTVVREKYSDRITDKDRLSVIVDEYKISSGLRMNAIGWFRENTMGKKTAPVETV